MENFTASFDAVVPISLMLAIGYILKKIGIIKPAFNVAMTKLCFIVFIPVLLFNTIAQSESTGAVNVKLIIFSITATVVIFFLLCGIIPLIERDTKKRGVLVQGILRSNFGIFGLSIAFSLCKDGNLGPIPLMVAIIIPLYSALSIVGFEIFRGEKINATKLLLTIITNPLIIGAAIGLIFMFAGIKFPTPIASAVDDISGLATPLSLIILGASFKFSEVGGYKKQLAIGLIGKLVIVPLLVLPPAIWIGFRGVDLICVMIMFAAPTAVSTFTIADQMDGDAPLAGQLVVLGSIISLVTIFGLILLLKSFMLI